MNDIQLFMRLYMYELEIWLNEHKQELLSISFQSDEANTDRPLKEFLKSAIENNCYQLQELENIESLIINGIQYDITPNIRNAVINKVILPPMPYHIKSILSKRKNTVFTEPDICLEIKINNCIKYETIELKSTKTDSIPGSSIQQIKPEEWVIFIKHTSNDIKVTSGQYYCAINTKMQFPDRSPRPQVSFNELDNWNHSCRKDHGKVIDYSSLVNESDKYELLTDWQGVLAKRWTKIVFDNHPLKNEPWFNNNLRKFILQFLEKYDNMSDKEKTEYKNFLENITE